MGKKQGILAIDPGPHTGIVSWERNTDEYNFATLDFPNMDWEDARYDAPHEALWYYLNQFTWWHDLDLVVEKFEYQKDKAQTREGLNYDAAEYVGVIKAWWYVKGMQELDGKLVMQSPSQAVGQSCFWTDAKLRQIGLWRSIKHERDALRHLLYYRTFTLGDKTLLHKLR